MIILAIIFAVMSVSCVVLQWTSSWIDSHDKTNTKEWKLKVVVMVHIILVSPIWLIQIITDWVKTRIERRNNNERP